MKKRIIQSLLAIACCVTVALSAIPTAEAAMRASVVTGKVTLNGQVIDNKTAKYPLLIYSNITYFPMTYHLSRFMGVSADWNNGSKTLDITAGGARTAYAAETGKSKAAAFLLRFPAIRSALTAHRSITRKKVSHFQLQRNHLFPAHMGLCGRLFRLELSVGCCEWSAYRYQLSLGPCSS